MFDRDRDFSTDEVAEIVYRWALRRYGSAAKRFTIELENGEKVRLPRHVNGTPEHRPAKVSGRRTHSADFHSVLWDGELYEFTTKQALVVRQLWEAWETGHPSVPQARLLEEAESDGNRLRDLFKNHPAWGSLIVPGAVKGDYRLADRENGTED